ncbi:hypothetical protein Pmani_013277 [Petrolisthes manimaculis]|uniref:Uncharacterized protein n=1 Tax=Petrolisthes manimaculis TaxID=1843537 RepID=A0AAE1PYW0_9EUCA|nr:hypothetical protein Pmani_013277 [Petrolisthes manimaculis]
MVKEEEEEEEEVEEEVEMEMEEEVEMEVKMEEDELEEEEVKKEEKEVKEEKEMKEKTLLSTTGKLPSSLSCQLRLIHDHIRPYNKASCIRYLPQITTLTSLRVSPDGRRVQRVGRVSNSQFSRRSPGGREGNASCSCIRLEGPAG